MSGKTCVVIGGGGGIGRKLLPRLADSGWKLVVAGRDEGRLSEAARCAPGAVIGQATIDATNFDDVLSLMADYPGVNGAVNLAGSILLKPAHGTSEEEFAQTMDQNARTAFATVRAAGKAMRDGGGSVVLMSSCAARIGLANHEAISAAKAAVEGLMRAAAASYADDQIRFNAVAPGLVDTPLAARITGNDASLKASKAMHPLGRIGDPDEVARVIAFLLEPESSWMTGQVVGVDGGVSMVKGK